jgi:NAD+ diphosphatase
MKYCPECAAVLEMRCIDGVSRKTCVSSQCGFVHWDNPVPVVAAFIEYKDKIVFARNVQWPQDMFSLITGYLEKNETPEAAVIREVKEEVGLEGVVREFIGCYSLFEKNQVILAYWVVATGEVVIGSEIAEVKLLSRAEVASWPFGDFAVTAAIARSWLAGWD